MEEEKGSYNQEDVDRALARVAAGEKKAAVARTSPVPLRTLFRLVKRAADGGSTGRSRPGPKPLMPAELFLFISVLTGYCDAESAEICVEYGIMLVALPANATHLFQPLDVALFTPFKDCVHDLMLERLFAISDPVIRKTTAIGMACTAHRRALIDQPTNAVNGFRECGIWPLCMVQLKARLELYKGGGVKGEIGTADWLKHREAVLDEVRNELLLLPPVPVTGKKRKRSTVDVAGRLVTKERMLAGAYD